MTEEVIQVEESAEASAEAIQNVQISVERIVAGILATSGPIKVDSKTLLANYDNYQIKVEQDNEDGCLVFSLTEVEIQAEPIGE